MAVFSFTLDSFQITDTRSLHEDTDYVTYTLVVKDQNGNGGPRMLTKYMGDVNNGVHAVNLTVFQHYGQPDGYGRAELPDRKFGARGAEPGHVGDRERRE